MALIGIKRKSDVAKERAPLPDVPADEIYVTGAAADGIARRLETEGHIGGILRVGIMGGGCSGLSYAFTAEAAPEDDDIIFTQGDARICVDERSLTHLGGTVLDWDSALGRSGFVMRNPHAKSSCSCGESFSL